MPDPDTLVPVEISFASLVCLDLCMEQLSQFAEAKEILSDYQLEAIWELEEALEKVALELGAIEYYHDAVEISATHLTEKMTERRRRNRQT